MSDIHRQIQGTTDESARELVPKSNNFVYNVAQTEL